MEQIKLHFKSKHGNPVCSFSQFERKITSDPKLVTCLACIYRMQKRGIPGTPKLSTKRRGRKPRANNMKNHLLPNLGATVEYVDENGKKKQGKVTKHDIDGTVYVDIGKPFGEVFFEFREIERLKTVTL